MSVCCSYTGAIYSMCGMDVKGDEDITPDKRAASTLPEITRTS